MNSDLDQTIREEPEPTAGNAAVPFWLTGLFALLLYYSCNYADDYGGGFHRQVYEPFRDIAALRAAHPRRGSDQYAEGEKIYNGPYCATCHQPTGLGVAGQTPPLAGSDWVTAPGPERIIRIVLHGLQGPIKINGTDFQGNAMVPWKDSLNDEQIAAVLTYIRNSWGNKASPVKPEQVKEIREKEKDRPQWTEAELLQIPLSQ